MKIAKQSVFFAVKERKLYQCSSGGMAKLDQDRGAFVTLKKHGELRGCIGYIDAHEASMHDCARCRGRRQHSETRASGRSNSVSFPSWSTRSPCSRLCGGLRISSRSKWANMAWWRGKVTKEGLLLPQFLWSSIGTRANVPGADVREGRPPPNAWKDKDTDIFMFTALRLRRAHSTPAP